jgi:quercetin dioxygenase-like cupin family protein
MQSTDSAGVTKQVDAVPRQPVAAGTATETHVLIGPEDGAPNFALRRFVMGPGGDMPRHTHAVEHEQFVLAGAARVTIGDTVHQVQAGTALYIPPKYPTPTR